MNHYNNRYRTFIGTLNNPKDNSKDILEHIFMKSKAKYVCG